MNTAKMLGLAIRFHRRKARLTQAQLARLAGVGKTVIFDAEKGKESIQLDTLTKIMAVLNMEMDLKSPLMQEFRKGLQSTSLAAQERS